MKEPHRPAIAVNMIKRLLRGREEHQEITLTVEALAAQICPAALYPLKAVLQAANVPSAVQRPSGTAHRQAVKQLWASAYRFAYVEQAML